MSFLDNITGALGGLLGQGGASALPGLVEKLYPGGLQGMLNQLQASGLGAQVNSWLGRGPNQPITVEDVRSALDNPEIRALADKLGIPADTLFAQLAEHLPAAVDRSSPNGTLQTPPAG